MSLIADPWNDQDVHVEELEEKISRVKINSHRAHSQWNDTTVSTARTMNGPIEAQPTVRIMKRDNAPSTGAKQVQAEKPVDKTLEERERAYAEARRRILGEDGGSSSPSQKPQNRARENQEQIQEHSDAPPPRRGGRGGGRGYRGHRGNRNQKPRNDEGRNGEGHYNEGHNRRPGGGNRGRGNRASGYRGQRQARANNDSRT
ncbi:Oidioi.mRNA.OKI2018_I69.chr2.g8124.t1.cds [Oikopleura dioica]|uniref:Oidioi.mRNA.OKI2018_I69.chr2.g8124.t1.cds n=1 Tax=Oikopleura dioica TaxID=34765 RepID=A0ABN7TCS9_OIKDI|nr:Oidioi.mRNA.OKI2018_I69.chr2.g8124.t1.cds [Oikopleura dioica]